MVVIKPPALSRGDTVALVAPSRPASEHGPAEAASYLRARGYHVHLSPHLHDRQYYMAGADVTRAGELNRLFANSQIRAVVCARGGYGCGRLLDRLDYGAISEDPKIVVGFSDSTALLLALYARSGLATLTGALSDFDFGENRNDLVEASLWPQLTSPSPFGRLPVEPQAIAVLRPGRARGPLVPANLALLCSLLATPYFPSLDGALLFLEDVEEYPYRVDRMLNQLRLAGILERLGGLIFGQFKACFTAAEMDAAPTLAELVDDHMAGTECPIIAGLPYGHFKRRLVLPVGVEAELETSPASLSLVGSAVV